MKQVYRIKDGHNAVIHGFETGDFSGADVVQDHNDNILRDVFKRVQLGLSEYAYMSTGNASGGLLYVVSRDTVYASAVRVSVFVRYGSGAGVRFYASSHSRFGSVCDFLRGSGLPSGRLIVVGGWYDRLKRG